MFDCLSMQRMELFLLNSNQLVKINPIIINFLSMLQQNNGIKLNYMKNKHERQVRWADIENDSQNDSLDHMSQEMASSKDNPSTKGSSLGFSPGNFAMEDSIYSDVFDESPKCVKFHEEGYCALGRQCPHQHQSRDYKQILMDRQIGKHKRILDEFPQLLNQLPFKRINSFFI